jgi:3D (Asp-Asp-Asp) domain-containing protein
VKQALGTRVFVEGPYGAFTAEDLGVPKNRFHDEAFAFHSE